MLGCQQNIWKPNLQINYPKKSLDSIKALCRGLDSFCIIPDINSQNVIRDGVVAIECVSGALKHIKQFESPSLAEAIANSISYSYTIGIPFIDILICNNKQFNIGYEVNAIVLKVR